MADSTTPIQQVVAGSGAATQVNDNFDGASPAMLYARNPVTTTGLTWGYVGGRLNSTSIASATVVLGASTTTYLVAHLTTGAVTSSTGTTNWNDTATYMRLYKIVTGASTVTSYEDHRQTVLPPGLAGHVGSGGAAHANAVAGGAAGFMTGADKTKLDGVATGATANSTDAQLRDRTTHTGTQAISTVTGLQAALDGKASIASMQALFNRIYLGGF